MISLMSKIHENGKHSRGRLRSYLVALGGRVERSVGTIGSGFANITSLGLIVMILMGTIDVIGTKLFFTPLPTTYESTESLMVVITFGGFAFVQFKKRNIKINLLVRLFSPKAQVVSELAGNLLGFAFFAALTWRSVLYFLESFKVREYAEGLVPFPIYPSKFVMLLGAGLVTLQLLVDVVHTVKSICQMAATPPQVQSYNERGN
jgi:TRAP-type C4-dicarboxylate transport system permease small subunit